MHGIWARRDHGLQGGQRLPVQLRPWPLDGFWPLAVAAYSRSASRLTAGKPVRADFGGRFGAGFSGLPCGPS